MKQELSIPVVSAIIERYKQDKKQILIMTRWKPDRDPVYSGVLELPGGKITAFEDVYEALKREVFEETGLHIVKIKPDSKTITYSPKNDGSFAFMPFCCQQQLKNGEPWIGFVFICEVEDKEPVLKHDEAKSIQWIDYSELRKIFHEAPEKFFTLQLGVLEFYFNMSHQ